MAELNLLRGTYHGSLGRTTGTRWKGKEVVHGRIWSKEPPSDLQTSNVRAFECLNRVAAAIAKKWWYWLGIDAKGMHKHNAVAKMLKDCIATHTFTPAGFFPCFKVDDLAEITAWTWDNETKELSFTAKTDAAGTVGKDFSWLVMVFDSQGRVYMVETPPAKSMTAQFFVNTLSEAAPFILTLVSVKNGKKYYLGGLSLNSFVVNEVYYTTFMQAVPWWYADPETIGTDSANVTYETATETLVVTP